MYKGDIRLGEVIDFKFTTVDTGGVPFTLAGSPVLSAYVGNSTTELTAGITLTVDFDGVTGLNHVRVVASGANGYATASNYSVVITTGTVDGASVVGYVVGEFSIEARSAIMPTDAGRTVGVNASGHVERVVLNDTTTTNTDMRGTNDALLAANYTAPLDAAGVRAALGMGAADMDTQLDAIVTAIGAISTTIGPAGAGLTAIPWNAAWDAEVQSEVQDAIEVNQLDHLIAVANPGGNVVNSSLWAALVSKSATPSYASYNNTTDSLEGNRDATFSNISTAVTDIGDAILDVHADVEAINTMVTAIQLDTNELQLDWQNGGRLDLILDSKAVAGDQMDLVDMPNTTALLVIANKVEAEIIDDTDSEKVLTAITDKIASVNPDLSGLTLAAIGSAVWSNATRILTAGTNIVLTKGVGLLGLNDIAATAIVSGGAIVTSAGAIVTVTNVTNAPAGGATLANQVAIIAELDKVPRVGKTHRWKNTTSLVTADVEVVVEI